MPARDYKLAVSPLTGTVYITKVSKKDPDVMTDDRIAVEKSTFIHCLLGWVESQLIDDQNTVSIIGNGKVIAEIILKKDKKDPNQTNLFSDESN